ncbi:MAG: CPBP family intramembrane metalloprotease [Armatimonadota bacterium]|nr:CPBP family intramembrane metalloprotease [Armatimonadota bacterium]
MNDETVPTSPEGPQAAPEGRKPIGPVILVFAALLLFAAAGAIRTGGSTRVRQDTAMLDVMSGDMYLKLSYLMGSLKHPGGGSRVQRRRALDSYTQAADASPSPRALRRIGLLSDNRAAALTAFARISSPKTTELVAKIDRPTLKREVAMWRRVYSGARLSPAEAGGYIRFLRRIDAGPARYIAEERIYRSAGLTAKAETVRRLATSRYAAHMIAVAVVVSLGALLGLAGVVALIVIAAIPARSRAFLRLSDRHTEDSPLQVSLWLSFLAYLVTFLIASAVGGVISTSAVEHLPWTARANYIVSVQIGVHAATVLAALLILRRLLGLAGGSLGSVGLRSRSPIADVMWGVGGYALALPLFGIGALFSLLIKLFLPEAPTPPNPALTMLLYASTPAALLGVFVLAGVIAPLIEETFFRGVLFRALRSRFGVWPGILVSAAAFALVHPLPAHFFPIMGLGVSFAVLLQARDSLLPCMVAHGIHNSAIFLLAILAFRP